MTKNRNFIALCLIFSGLLYAQKTPVPLPYLNVLPKEEKQAISVQTQNNITSLTENSTISSKEAVRPYIFSEDIARTDYQLSLIVEKYFISQKWVECETELRKFLLINRSAEITARANFYLGQVLYFRENYESALFSFLETMDYFPAQSNLWIESSLNKISQLTE